jgi:hypothetical protein
MQALQRLRTAPKITYAIKFRRYNLKRKAYCVLLMNKLHSQNERNQDYILQRRAIAFYLRKTFHAMLLNYNVRKYNREQATSLYVRKLCINFFRLLIQNKE